jgi:hypothetical protein
MLIRLLITWLTNCVGLLIAAAIIGPRHRAAPRGILVNRRRGANHVDREHGASTVD